MKNNKIYIYLIIFNAILFIGLGIYFGITNNSSSFIILSDMNVYTIKNNKLVRYEKNISKKININVKEEDLRNLSFTYIDGKLTFYDDSEEVELKDYFEYAYTNDIDIKSIDIDEQDIDYDEYATMNKILHDHDINGYTELTLSKKINVEGKTLYFISNLFEEFDYDKVFSFVYYIENDEVKYLIENVASNEDAYDICVPKFNSSININNQEVLIIDCRYFSEIGIDTFVYDNNLEKIN